MCIITLICLCVLRLFFDTAWDFACWVYCFTVACAVVDAFACLVCLFGLACRSLCFWRCDLVGTCLIACCLVYAIGLMVDAY